MWTQGRENKCFFFFFSLCSSSVLHCVWHNAIWQWGRQSSRAGSGALLSVCACRCGACVCVRGMCAPVCVHMQWLHILYASSLISALSSNLQQAWWMWTQLIPHCQLSLIPSFFPQHSGTAPGVHRQPQIHIMRLYKKRKKKKRKLIKKTGETYLNRAALLTELVNSVTGLSSNSLTNGNCAVPLIQTHTKLCSRCKKVISNNSRSLSW